MQDERTAQSEYLLRLGRKILEPYTRLPAARAAMITGSAAEGVSDHYSDLDMTVYYEGELPSEEVLAAIREGHGAPERAWLLGERADGNIAEAYELDGVQAQIGHATIAAWENDIAEVLERWNADTPLHKAMSGTLECVAVHGEEHIERWKDEDPRLSRGIGARDGGNAAADLSRVVRPGRARRARRDALALSDPHRDRLRASSAFSPD